MRAVDLTGRKLSRSNWMFVNIAYKKGVQFEKLPKGRFLMSYGSRSYVIRSGRIFNSYNSELAVQIMDMKDVMSSFLRNKGYSAPENCVFAENEVLRAWQWAENILPVVLKPYNGKMGRSVYVNIKDYNEFKEFYEEIATKYGKVLAEKFIKGDEYRFTFVNGRIVGIANRIPANVVGDGINTVERLVLEKNKERNITKNPIHKKIELDDESKRVLTKNDRSLVYIPNFGERIFLRENSNVSTGGDAIDVTDQIDINIKRKISKALQSIQGLKVCGADVLIDGGKITILEINSNPMLSMHHFPWEGKRRNVIGKVVEGMFPELKK